MQNTPKNTPSNLLPAWKKGQSGNQKGRPKGSRNFSTLFLNALIKMKKEGESAPFIDETDLVVEYLKQAKNNSTVLINLIDRLYGKPTILVEAEQVSSRKGITSVVII